MSSEDSNTGKKVFIGAAVAAAVGYVAGILTAPKSGKETRQDLIKLAGKAREEAEKKLTAMRGDLDETIEKAKLAASKLSGTAKQELHDALDKATIAKDKSAEVLKALRKGDATDPDLKLALEELKAAKNNLVRFVKN